MATLSRLASVTISLATTGIRQQSFSKMLILGDHIASVARVQVITNADDLLDLGLRSTDPLYLAAQAAFSQIPSVEEVFIGRRAVGAATVDVVAAAGSTYSVTIGWRGTDGQVTSATATYTLQAGDTPTTIAAGLVTALNGLGATITATSTGPSISVTAAPAGSPISVTGRGSLVVSTGASTEPIADALNACMAESDEWYGLVLASRNRADQKAAMAWAEANERLFSTATDEVGAYDPLSSTDLMAYAQQNQFFRTAVWYSAVAGTSYIDAAAMGKMFTYRPGSENWANQSLAGIAYDKLTEAQFKAISAKNGNTFEPFRNFAVTQRGRVAGGEWIDIIRGRDWLVEEVRVNCVYALINTGSGKIPYTDHGIQVFRNAVTKALTLGVTYGLIAPPEIAEDEKTVIPSYTVDVPRASSISANQKASRVLKDVRFSARLAGAINLIEVWGRLGYDDN